MYKILFTLFFFIGWGTFLWAVDSVDSIDHFKKAIHDFRETNYPDSLKHMEMIPTPQFKNMDIFYFYRGSIRYHALQQKSSSVAMRGILKKALMDLQLALSYDPHPVLKNKVIELKKEILQKKILSEYNDDKWMDLILSCEALDELEPSPPRIILFYVEALLHLNRESLARGVVGHYYTQLKLIPDHDFESLPLPIKREFQMLLQERAELLEKEQKKKWEIVKTKESPPQTILQSFSSLIKNASSDEEWEQIFTFLKKHFYLKEVVTLTLPLRELYLKALQNENPSDRESIVIKQLEKNWDKIHPSIIIPLIMPLWRKSHFEKAEEIIQVVEENYPAMSEIPRMLFYRAKLAEDRKNFKLAQKLFQKAYESTLDHEESEEAFYKEGWNCYLGGEEEKAYRLWQEYLKLYPKGPFAVNARYFSLIFLNKSVKDINLILQKEKELLEKHPIDFYTLYYFNQQGKDIQIDGMIPIEKKDEQNIESKIKRSLKWQNIFRRVDELKKLALYEEAQLLLEALSFDSENLEGMLYLAKELGVIQKVDQSIIMYTRLVRSVPESLNYLTLFDIFPLYWEKEIKEGLKKLGYNYPSYSIMSLMRQESVFSSTALSKSNAKGLMQIIDGTATATSRSLNMANYDLFNPKENILLGIKILHDSLQTFDGKFYLALCAYNAGPENAKRWFRWRGDMDPILFIESIPYKETNSYVKAILRNAFLYQMLYEKKKLSEIKPLFILN